MSAVAVRVGPEHASALAPALGAFEDAGLLRCPLGSLVVGLDVGLPPPSAGTPPFTATVHRLRCAPVDGQGALGAVTTVETPAGAPAWPFEANPYADYVWSTLACPTGEVATRLVGAFDRAELTQIVALGLRCQPLASLTDGGAVTVGTPTSPATLGATGGPEPLDIACQGGGALAGIAYGTTSTKPRNLELRTLCRDVLRTTLPGGAPWDPSSPVKLGPPTTTAPLTTNGELPANPDTIKVVRDCPAGQVVSAVDAGRSKSVAGSVLLDVQLSCRALGPDGALGAQVTDVGTTLAPRQSACLLGQVVSGITFSGDDFEVLGKKYPNAKRLLASCRVPVPGDGQASSPIPGFAPGPPLDVEPRTLPLSCPTGSVMTGMDLFAPLDSGERTISGLSLRCRAITR